MIRAIIFDCFGVLVGQGFNATYARAGGDPVKDRIFIKDLLGAASLGVVSRQHMLERICEQLGITPRAWLAAVRAMEQPDTELLTYIKQMLKPQYKVAILSNANVGVLQRKFSDAQLALFDAIVVSAEEGIVKPDPDIYHLAAERLGVEPTECLFTDDSAGHCQAAAAVGMTAIHYSHFRQFKEDLGTVVSRL